MDLLLVAQSARMLAQSAARAGVRSYAIDYFADQDTRRYAEQSLALPSRKGGFVETELLEAVRRIAPPGREVGLIYGSGIDTRPQLLEKLALGRRLLGNSPETLRRINKPRAFFQLLAELDIPYPPTVFSPPSRRDAWLVKPCCGEGGKGVRFFAEQESAADEEVYYQRYIEGEPFSLLFLANGEGIRIIGFNTQWTANHDSDRPFLFAGATNRADLGGRQREAVAEYAAKLTSATRLVGLNSLDFLADGGTCRVLEINPRPSATMALYDEDFAEGLLSEHIAACRGELPPCARGRSPVRAIRIVYAPEAVIVPKDFPWPKECADIPDSGARIGAGQPLCSLMVRCGGEGEAEDLSNALANAILRGMCRKPPD